MSLNFNFEEDKFSLNKLKLPSRHYHFNDNENYIKLLNIGEGIFPKDRIKTNFKLQNSNLILTTESATKIYKSKKEYGVNYINIELQDSNLEFINDELILYKDSKLIQTFRLKFDESSTFFYVDILTDGRSYENFEFSSLKMKNSFFKDSNLEYIEKFDLTGYEIKNYITRKKSENSIFAKFYIRNSNNDKFLDELHSKEFESFTFSRNKEIIIGSLSGKNMFLLKNEVKKVWDLYRKSLNKNSFNLGKQ